MNTRYKSQQAQAAAEIRTILKTKFPGIKFRVTSEGYSMGDNVNVSWTDGPKREDVESLICQYQYGNFNGMEDIYENTNSRDDIPQTKYLFCERSVGSERRQRAVDWLNAHTTVNCSVGEHGEILGDYSQEWQEWPSAIIHRMTSGYYSRSNSDMDFS
jgi:hypothetical protein